jgi:hypothetical protein
MVMRKEPTLVVSSDVKEVFANRLYSIDVRDGIVMVNFAMRRRDGNAVQPTESDQIVCRLALTGSATNDLLNQLERIRADAQKSRQHIQRIQ